MPSIELTTGNYYRTQQADMLDSLIDAFQTPLGSRLAYPNYGFIIDSWPQVVQDDRGRFEAYCRAAAMQDTRVNRVTIEYDYTRRKVTVTAIGLLREDY